MAKQPRRNTKSKPWPDDNEYRQWVRRDISTRMTLQLASVIGVTGIVGVFGLSFYIANFLSAGISDDVKTKLENSLSEKAAEAVASLLVNSDKLIEAPELKNRVANEVGNFLNSDPGKEEVANAASSEGVVGRVILEEARKVVDDASALPPKRAQALQLLVLFEGSGTETRRQLRKVLEQAADEIEDGDEALVRIAMQSYPFDVRNGRSIDPDMEGAAERAVLKRLAKLDYEPSGENAAAYRSFLSHIQPDDLSEVASWLVENSGKPAAPLVAGTLVGLTDRAGMAIGVQAITPLLNREQPATTRALVVHALASEDSLGVGPDTRETVFRAIWSGRDDADLKSALREMRITLPASTGGAPLRTEVGAGLPFPVSGLTPDVDAALLRLIRADDEGRDWLNFMGDLLDSEYREPGNGAARSDLLSLWLRRIEMERSEGFSIGDVAGQTLESIGSVQGAEFITTTEDIEIVEYLIGHASSKHFRSFVLDIPRLSDNIDWIDDEATTSLMETVLKRDANNADVPFANVWDLLDTEHRTNRDSNKAFARQFAAAVAEIVGVPGGSGIEALVQEGLIRLRDTGSDTTSVALIFEAASRIDRRNFRDVLFTSGALAKLPRESFDTSRLAKVARRLAEEYPSPDCTGRFKTESVVPGTPKDISVTSGDIRRVAPKEGVFRVTLLRAPPQVDLFVWDDKCARAIQHLDESKRTGIFAIATLDEVIQVAAPLGADAGQKTSDNTKNTDVDYRIEAVGDNVISHRFQINEDGSSSGKNNRELTLPVSAGETVWMRTRDLTGGVDTSIALTSDASDESIATDDDSGPGLASALRVEAPTEGAYHATISDWTGEFKIGQEFSFEAVRKPLLLPAESDLELAPTLVPDHYIEIAANAAPLRQPEWIKIRPKKTAFYAIETFSQFAVVPLVRDRSLNPVTIYSEIEPLSDASLQEAATMLLVGGTDYFLRAPSGIGGRSLLKLRMVKSTLTLGKNKEEAPTVKLGNVDGAMLRTVKAFEAVPAGSFRLAAESGGNIHLNFRALDARATMSLRIIDETTDRPVHLAGRSSGDSPDVTWKAEAGGSFLVQITAEGAPTWELIADWGGEPFDGVAIGDRVVLGRDVVLDGYDDLWIDAMDSYVGCTATITAFPADRQWPISGEGLPLYFVFVDRDGGDYSWQTQSLKKAEVGYREPSNCETNAVPQ